MSVPFDTQNESPTGEVKVDDGFVYQTSDEAARLLLLDLCRRFKHIDPEVDARIDAHAGFIAGNPLVQSIPGYEDFEPRVPSYYEGEPGVGKTSLIATAAQWFCEIAGLRLVMDPPDGYRFGPKDLYFFSETMAGQTNAMAIGGLPTRAEMYPGVANDSGSWVGQELQSKARTIEGLMQGSIRHEVQTSTAGDGRRLTKLTVTGDPAKVRIATDAILEQLIKEAREKGQSFAELGSSAPESQAKVQIATEGSGRAVSIEVSAPPALNAEQQYVSQMLPNRRFAMANQARFTVVNFDDIANVPAMVRNVILEIAQKNRYAGIVDLGRAFVTLTGNSGYEDGTNTMSDQSDAEVSRVHKVRIRDTPTDWAGRMARKYGNSPVGDCFFASFVKAHGDEPGIFRPLAGDDRSAKGIPKPNSRSLENALAKCRPWFIMAHDAGLPVTVFREEISNAFKATAGSTPALRFMAHFDGMTTDAIPIANQLLETGVLDHDKLDSRLGSGARASEKTFEFRFTAALVNAFVYRISFSDEAAAAKGDVAAQTELIADSMQRMALGVSQLSPDMLTQCMSQLVGRLGSNSRLAAVDGARVKLSDETEMAMTEGFGRSVARGDWGSTADEKAHANEEFSYVVSGAMRPSSRKASTPAMSR